MQPTSRQKKRHIELIIHRCRNHTIVPLHTLRLVKQLPLLT